MVFIIQSDDLQIDSKCIFSLNHQPKIRLKGFPTFYSKQGKYIYPVNLWMNYLINLKKSKNINSNVRSIKRYWNFLEENNFSWDVFPTDKLLKPTYRFRNDNLLASIKRGEIEASTASLYMLHVIKFYEWAGHEQLIKFDKLSKPFDYEYLKISNQGGEF
ncbi:hypothetical protein ACMAZF_19610 [Psychrobium sp. nBUS_13]|uniref:hypothetical protein n=1 Tax=Psychrobium sp. nBUS_13 TaxID=3395319 RepID=UPI003EBE3A75